MLARYRNLVTPLALMTAGILIYMENPWFGPEPGSAIRTVATFAFWILSIVVLVLMFQHRKSPQAQTVESEGPAFARYLFKNSRAGLLWLPIRIFLGFEWFVASSRCSSTTTPRASSPGASCSARWPSASACSWVRSPGSRPSSAR